MLRNLALALIALAALIRPDAAPAQPQRMDARFDVRALGLKVGELTMAGSEGAGRYALEARFATTGLVRLLRDMGFVMAAQGQSKGDSLLPDAYSETVNTGNRTSSARMRYRDGTPELIEGKVDDGEVAPLDPAGETGTLDPLSAMFTVLRDQPISALCHADLLIFDGGRRTRVRLTGGTRDADSVTCNGQFIRVAGYPARDLQKRRVVPLTITYGPADAGLMQVEGASLRTDYGPVGLTRRP